MWTGVPERLMGTLHPPGEFTGQTSAASRSVAGGRYRILTSSFPTWYEERGRSLRWPPTPSERFFLRGVTSLGVQPPVVWQPSQSVCLICALFRCGWDFEEMAVSIALVWVEKLLRIFCGMWPSPSHEGDKTTALRSAVVKLKQTKWWGSLCISRP